MYTWVNKQRLIALGSDDGIVRLTMEVFFQLNVIFNFCCCAIGRNYVYCEAVLESLDEARHWPEAATFVLAKSWLCCCTVVEGHGIRYLQ